MRKRLERELRHLLRAASLYHKQRLQLKREQAVLRSKKQELEDQRRHLQHVRERPVRRQENRRRHSYSEYGFNVSTINHEGDGNHITYDEYRNNGRPLIRAKSSRHASFTSRTNYTTTTHCPKFLQTMKSTTTNFHSYRHQALATLPWVRLKLECRPTNLLGPL